MRAALLFLLVAFLITAMACAADPRESEPATAATQPTDATGFAVVELFTSEGCSSCPPADAVLADLTAEARESGEPVYTLAFHVDYWDRLGWKDPYSDAVYSQRQRAYGQALGLRNVYTPQMIVNGAAEFNGSNRQRAEQVIDEELQKKAAQPTLTIKLSRFDPWEGPPERAVYLRYAAGGDLEGQVLRVAVVERHLSTEVERGENRGRTLRHENVVRWWQTVSLEEGGDWAERMVRIDPPADVDQTNASVIAYLQDVRTMRITAAAKVPFPG